VHEKPFVITSSQSLVPFVSRLAVRIVKLYWIGVSCCAKECPMADPVVKTCPACFALVAGDIAECECGHVFAQSPGSGSSVDPQALEEAMLMQEYLYARVEQAVSALDTARALLTADPHNFEKAARVLKAVQEAADRRGELEAQKAYIEHLRQMAAPTLQTPASETPAMSDRASEAFRARQAVRAGQVMAAFEGVEARECPQCHTALPVSTVLCLCGYRFPIATPATGTQPSRPKSGPGYDGRRSS
jgi:hypothetical protein